MEDIIRRRRSIRKFRDADIPKQDLEKMLEAAMLAPSACNTRPWEFYVVRDITLRENFVKINPHSKQILSASLCIVVCGRPDLQEGICSSYWPQECGAAIENLLLEATKLGYGTCWCGIYPSPGRSEKIKNLLHCKGIPVAMIAVGIADEAPVSRGCFDPERVHYL